MASISTSISVSSKNLSKADANTTNPGGTEIPTPVISPKDAPFPPAIPTSFFDNCLNVLVNPLTKERKLLFANLYFFDFSKIFIVYKYKVLERSKHINYLTLFSKFSQPLYPRPLQYNRHL